MVTVSNCPLSITPDMVLSAFSAELLFAVGDGSCGDSQLAKALEKSDRGVLSPESHNYTSPPRPRGLHRRAFWETGASPMKCLLDMTWPSGDVHSTSTTCTRLVPEHATIDGGGSHKTPLKQGHLHKADL